MPVDFSSRAPQILTGVIVPFSIASIFVAGRLYARAVIVRAWGWDDTFVIISWTLSLGVTIAECLSTIYGSGHHQDATPISSATPALKLQYANILMYQAALASTKFSICLFYLRLFPDRQGRYLVIGTMIWIMCYFMPCEVIEAFQCDPLPGIWDKTISSKCVNNLPCFYTSAVCNIVGDAWLICIIAPRIWPLQMPRRQKIALMSVVTSGWLVIVAAVVRVIRVSRFLTSEDRSWTYYDMAIWSSIELAVGLFCVSAPAIKPLLQKYTPGFVASFSGPHSYDSYDNRYHNNYLTIITEAPRGTVTYVNSGQSANTNEIERDIDLQEPKGMENGKVNSSSISRSNSKGGNRTFWWDRKSGSDDTDSESVQSIVVTPEFPAGFESPPPPPAMGIMRSTSVTVRVEIARPSQTADIRRSQSMNTHLTTTRRSGEVELESFEESGKSEAKR